jgi:hypothetical protein
MSDLLDLLKQLWSEAPLGQLALVSSGLSAGAAVWLGVRASSLELNVEAFAEQIGKLINSGNVERAIKLCNACGDMPQGKLVKRGLEARLHGNSAMVAMQEAQPAALATLQRGLVPAMFIGAMAGLSSAALLAAHMQALALLDAGVMAFAARQWMRAARDLNLLVRQTGDL